MKTHTYRLPLLGVITHQSEGMPWLKLVESAREKLMNSDLMNNARGKISEKINLLSQNNQKNLIQSKRRKTIGWTLLGMGLLATIPLITRLFQSHSESVSRDFSADDPSFSDAHYLYEDEHLHARA